MSEREIIVGIDLGTTFSVLAWADESGAHVLRDDAGDARVPSVLSVIGGRDGRPPRVVIGWEARRHAVENADATAYSVKRLIGKSIEDLRKDLPYLAYSVRPGPRQTVQVEIGGRSYSPEEVSGLILRELRQRAERHFGRPIHKAVVTVPAYFDDAQRQATRDAAAAAGLEAVRIINEPTAAALAYGIGLRGADQAATAPREQGTPLPQLRESPPGAAASPAERPGEIVAVYDLGGGTFDISILRIERGLSQVLSTAGDTHLGGDDFDRAIIDAVAAEAFEQYGVRVDSPRSRQALRTLAEEAKLRLSDAPHADVEFDLGGGRVYRRRILRDEFERWIAPLVERTIALLDRALGDARLRIDELAHVILVGGSTRVPLVRRRVAERFGRPPYVALNPDEVVALGAAVQASVLAGRRADLLLLDVTPLSLGIETLGGAMGKLIVRNTAIPCRATEMFTTFVDGQTAIRLGVLQGERELARDCRRLGEFELRGIPPMPAGLPKIEVEFLIDANGILNVSARELRSGQKAAIQIVPNYGLTREEVERIARESVRHAREDVAAHRRIDLQNQVRFDCEKARQMLARVGHLLPPDERRRIERDMAALQNMAENASDLDELHGALGEFGRGTLRLAELGIAEALRMT